MLIFVHQSKSLWTFWREMYLVLNYFSANVTASLAAGSANEIEYGIKIFLLSGTEFEFLSVQSKTIPEAGAETAESRLQAQLHFYF